MIQVTVNGEETFQLEKQDEGWKLNGRDIRPDMMQISENTWHLLLDNRSYRISIEERTDAKHMRLSVNGVPYEVGVKSEFDQLLEALGMDAAAGNKADDIKAPMPGLVLKVLIEEGQEVEQGTPLLVLEAMKMENMIKAPAAATVSSINVKPGDAVEKNLVLISFS